MSKKTNYRCSCCDKMVKEGNKVWREWNHNNTVAICRSCNNEMKKDKQTYVGTKVSMDGIYGRTA